MEERASGIILRTRPLTETSLIVHWLTPGHGRIACVAKGARRPKSPFLGKLDLCYEADFSFVRSRKSELHNLREVILRNLHSRLREDLPKLNAAAYMAVLIEHGTEIETPLPEHYQLFQEVLEALDQRSPGVSFIYSLELRFLDLAGTAPSRSVLSSGAAGILGEIEASPLSAADDHDYPSAFRNEVGGFLRRAIGTTLEKLPPQRERLFRSIARTPLAPPGSP